MTSDEIETCWKDPHNQKWGVYYCKSDPRVIVPRHIKWMGWTINAAHPGAVPVVLLLMAVLVAPQFIVNLKGGSMEVALLTFAVSVSVVCSLSAYLSSLKRWSH